MSSVVNDIRDARQTPDADDLPRYFLRKPFGRSEPRTPGTPSLTNEQPAFGDIGSIAGAELANPRRFWDAFNNMLEEIGVSASIARPEASPDVQLVHAYANDIRAKAHEHYHERIVTPALLHGRETRVFAGPTWGSMTADWKLRGPELLIDAATAIMTRGEPIADLIKTTMADWIETSTLKPSVKRRYPVTPEVSAALVGEMRSIFHRRSGGVTEFEPEVGGFNCYLPQALYPLGARLVIASDPKDAPQIAFERQRAPFPFRYIDGEGNIRRFEPGSEVGDTGRLGNIVVKIDKVPREKLAAFARACGCSERAIGKLEHLEDSSNVLNGGSGASIASAEKIDAIRRASRVCDSAVFSGIQRITSREIAASYRQQLEAVECPIYLDMTPPSTDVPGDVAADLVHAVRANRRNIALVTLNTTEAKPLLLWFQEAIRSGAISEPNIVPGDIERILYFYRDGSGECDRGEHPLFVAECASVMSQLLGTPVRCRGRRIDCQASPGTLAPEEREEIQLRINGTRQNCAMKAYSEFGFPISGGEMIHFGNQVHPANLAAVFAIALFYHERMSLEDFTRGHLAWEVKTPAGVTTVVAGITEEFAAESQSLISLGDHIVGNCAIFGALERRAGKSASGGPAYGLAG